MLTPQLLLDVHPEIVVDGFAGGGGMSTGIEQVIRRYVDAAINHNPQALSLHEANHPQTRHYVKDVREVDPREVAAGRPVGALHLSPDCTQHSQAKGGQPRDEEIRALSWVALHWGGTVRPRFITLENVKEILRWGPLIAKRDKATGRVLRVDGSVAAPGEVVPRREQFLIPDPKRQGSTWRRFVRCLEALGYVVETRVLCAADYGVPTTRTRLFMVARCDGVPIQWPTPTHFKNPKKGQKKWLAAATCIDWSIDCPTIFDRKKPLAEATMRRIAHGMHKYVLADSADPFIVEIANWSREGVYPTKQPLRTVTASPKGGAFALASAKVAPAGVLPLTHQGSVRVNDPAEPMRTVTGANRGELALAAATLAPAIITNTSGHPGAAADQPLPTVTTAGNQMVAAATLVQAGHGEGKDGTKRWSYGANDINGPLGTITASGGGQSLATATLVQLGYGERQGQTPRAMDVQEPLGTVVAGGIKHGLTEAFVVQANGGFNTTHARDVRDPLSTVTTSGSQQQLVATHLLHLRGNCDARDAQEPLRTISAGGEHHGVVEYRLAPEDEAGALRCAAFLMRYHGSGGQWSDPRDPLTTITTKDRLALVTVWLKGEPYVIVDIGLRMLTPRELFNANGFPRNYIIDRGHDGRVFTKTQQVKFCGNAVPPGLGAAVFGANWNAQPELRRAA